MAQITTLVDDLDKSTDDVQTVRFALAGKAYEIDLSAKNRKQLEAQLSAYVAAARTPGSSATPAASKPKGTRNSNIPEYDKDDLKRWAEPLGKWTGKRPSAALVAEFLEATS